MADYTWPATLPSGPLLDQYEEQPPDLTIRTEMEAGPDKVRRRMTDSVRPMKCRFSMTSAQVTILDGFFVTTLSGGASRFNWTHPRTGSSDEFRFRKRPAYRPEGGGYWEVEVELEKMP